MECFFPRVLGVEQQVQVGHKVGDSYLLKLRLISLGVNAVLTIVGLVFMSGIQFWGHISTWAAPVAGIAQITLVMTHYFKSTPLLSQLSPDHPSLEEMNVITSIQGEKYVGPFNRLGMVFFITAWTIVFFTTVGFWVMVIPLSLFMEVDQEEMPHQMGGMEINIYILVLAVIYVISIHLIPILTLYLDMRSNLIPFPIIHFCFPIALALFYFALTLYLTYYIGPMYPFLTYKDPLSAVIILISLIILILGFCLGRRHALKREAYIHNQIVIALTMETGHIAHILD